MLKSITWTSLFILMLAGCDIQIDGKHISNGKTINGGKAITEKRTLTAFTSIENRSFLDLVITSGQPELEITADEKLLPDIETVVENQRLIIRKKM
jgi:hypothetical protein